MLCGSSSYAQEQPEIIRILVGSAREDTRDEWYGLEFSFRFILVRGA
jgi:hypothetical protein